MSGYTPIAATLRAKYGRSAGVVAAPERHLEKKSSNCSSSPASPDEAQSTKTSQAPPATIATLLQSGDAAALYECFEREAIASIDGGLPQSWAVSLAAIEHGPRPAGISEREWRTRLDDVWRRADALGSSFAAHGWTFEEVFGVGEHWLRLDRRGAAWLAPEARVVAIDSERIVFERGRERTTHRKPARSH